MNAPAVQIKKLIVHAGRRCVLDVDELQIPAAEITAIMGLNGAGKTTLLRACLGFVTPTHGKSPRVGLQRVAASRRVISRRFAAVSGTYRNSFPHTANCR